MKNKMLRKLLLCMLSAVLLLSGLLLGQNINVTMTNVSNLTSTPQPGSGHDYIHMLNETVSPANGSVSVRLQIPTPRGRGLNLPFGFAYDSTGVHGVEVLQHGGALLKYNDSYPPAQFWSGGWSYIMPQLAGDASPRYDPNAAVDNNGNPVPCKYRAGYIFTDPSGGRHSLNMAAYDQNNDSLCPQNESSFYNGQDGFYQGSPGQYGLMPSVVGGDGTVYQFAGAVPGGTLIEDRNGNQITLLPAPSGFTATDTLGRTLLTSSGFGGNGGGAQNGGFGSTTVSVSGLSQPYRLAWGSASASFSVAVWDKNGPISSITEPPTNFHVVSAFTLPNGQQYTFQYDPTYGLLKQITFPGGGWVKYDWGQSAKAEVTTALVPLTYIDDNGQTVIYGYTPSSWMYSWPVVTRRSVSFDGIHVALQQDFQYSTGDWSYAPDSGVHWGSKKTTVTTRDLVTGNVTVQIYSYLGAQILPNDPVLVSPLWEAVPAEQSIVYQDGAGHALRTVNKTWYASLYPDQLKSEETVLENGQKSKVVFGPYFFGGFTTEKDEYDFDQSTPSRTTSFAYKQFPQGCQYCDFFGMSFFYAPSSVSVTDGSGKLVAETDYSYDEGFVTGVTNLTGHDKDAYGSASTLPRGNVTTVTHKCFPNCSDSVSTYTYDETGQVLSAKNPNGNTTAYSYTDDYSEGTPPGNTNAYVTKITYPKTGSVDHIEKFSYAYADGWLMVATDQNNQQTKYFYNDSLRRLTELDSADGGKTTYDYHADALPLTVTKTVLATPGPSIVTSTIYDGIGQVATTSLDSDPAGASTIDVTYDGLGHAATQTNPHRSSTSPTDGITQYSYDALGRVTQTTRQDGSISTVAYTGNCTTATDEAGKQRLVCSDALGRLLEVDEPGGGSAGTQASGGLTIGGTLQTRPGTNPTPGTGSVTFSGSEQSTNATVVVAVANAGFETPALGAGNFQYSPTGGNWTFNGAGVSGNGSGFTVGNPASPEGSQVAFLQGAGSTISQVLSGFQAGVSYTVTFLAAQRGNFNHGGQDFDVYLDAILLGTFGPASTSYSALSTPAFTTTAGSHTLKFVGRDSAGGDNTAFIDAVQVTGISPIADTGTVTVTVNGTPYTYNYGANDNTGTIAAGLTSTINAGSLVRAVSTANADVAVAGPGFETPSLGSGATAYQYHPASSGWTFSPGNGLDANGIFTGGAGLTGNGSGFTSANPSAPEGSQAAFLQGGPANFFSQSLSGFQTGASYTVTFLAAQRGNNNNGGQDFDVYLDAILLATFRPASTSYSSLSTPAFTTTAGSHTLKFVGRDSAGGDNTAFIDAVRVAAGNVISLTSSAMGSAANYTLLTSVTSNSGQFASPSFTGSASGATLTGGSNGGAGATDSGTVTLSIAGYSATANYGNGTGQDSTAAAISSDLVTKIQAQLPASNPPFSISAAGTAITVNWSSVGAAGNVAMNTTSATTQTSSFSTPSFASCSITSNPQNCNTTLSGGADPAPASLQIPYVTLYGYDTLGNLLRVDQKGSASSDSTQWRTRLFTYNSLSRLLTAYNPESGPISYSYDANGNVITKTAPKQNQTGSATVTTTYTYDVLNRLTSKTYSDGTPSAYQSYDAGGGWGVPQTNVIGRLAEAWVGTPCCVTNGATIFGYDAMGRVVMSNQSTPGVSNRAVNYAYDLAGDVTSSTTGVGVTFTQAFDSAGRVTQLTSNLVGPQWPATLATVDPNIGYYATGAVRKVTLGNGLTETAAFNVRLQPCHTNVNSSGSALLNCADAVPTGNVQDFNYGFNLGTADNGNVLSMSATGFQSFNRTYSYDALNRLLTMSAPGDPCSGLSWTYDAWGNRTDQTVTGGSCNTFHQPANTQNRLYSAAYQYDAAGNLTNDGFHSYAYDAENRIIQVDGGNTASYVYDALGYRVRKSVASTWTDYVYDLAGNVVTEYISPVGACAPICWATSYIYLNGQLVAEYKDATTYFVHKDRLGSTRLLSKMDRTPKDSMDYLPYGEQIAGDTSTSHKFTGKERDSESGLDLMGARYYSSGLGRFMTTDPVHFQASMLLDPQRFNLYAYVRNNPLRFVDPKGESIELTGDEEQRKKELAAAKDAVGAQAGAYLYENKVETTDKDGNKTTRYFIGIYTNGPDGQGPAFQTINKVASALASAIGVRDVLRAEVLPQGTLLTDHNGGQDRIGSLNIGASPGISYWGKDGYLHMAILDPSTDPGKLPGSVMSNGEGFVDQGILFGHELGHNMGPMGAWIPSTDHDAVDLENQVRKLKDPSGPTRTSEHP